MNIIKILCVFILQCSLFSFGYAKSSDYKTSSITSWNISGSMAAKRGHNGWNANVNWLQKGNGNYQIRLMGPVGSGTILITKKNGSITCEDGSKKTDCNNPSQMLQKETGINLPLNNLYYWVRAIPAPGASQVEKRDKSNRITKLRQSGYTINYSNFSGKDLPGKISMYGNGTSIRFVIRSW